MFISAVGLEPPQLSVSEERHLAILTELPFVVPFEERVKVSHSWSAHSYHNKCTVIMYFIKDITVYFNAYIENELKVTVIMKLSLFWRYIL